jgi:hypothetical protein
MPRTVDDAIRDVKARQRGQTYYTGREPHHDELLVDEIDALRAAVLEAIEIIGTSGEIYLGRFHAAVIARALADARTGEGGSPPAAPPE